MKSSLILFLLAGVSLRAQDGASVEVAPPAPAAATPAQAVPPVFEPLPTLSASAILLPPYDQGPNFQVQDPVPTYSGANAFTINSDFGVFQAGGNAMLMRRVSEINAIAVLNSVSATQEFADAAKKAAESPLVAAKELVTNPVGTISGVPKGIWKFLNQAGESVKEIGEGRKSDPEQGNVATNMLGFSKVKRDLALRLGVDPYSSNEVFQQALNRVAWPAFAGGFTVDIGMAAVTAGIGTAGIALSAVNWTGNLNDLLRNNSPSDLRLYNLGLLLNMGVNRPDADAFLNNNALSPTTQTILVAALANLDGTAGRDEFIRQATTSTDEHDALFFQQSAQLMDLVDDTTPVTTITQLNGLPVCLTEGGGVVVPIQWDFVAWTPMTARFVSALKSANFGAPATGVTVVLTGVVSQMAAQNLTTLGVGFVQKQLPGPLR